MKLLIVEDNVSDADHVRAILQTLNTPPDVRSAATVEEARAILKADQPDVVLLDIMLEEGNVGLDLLWDIRRLCPRARIVVITGLPHGHPSVETTRTLKPHAILLKPLRSDDLLRAVLSS